MSHDGRQEAGGKAGSIEITEMTEEDLPRVAEIERQNFSCPWKEKDFHDFIVRDDAIFLTARYDGEIAGYIGFYGIPDEGDITNVSVDRRFRRRGIGFALIRELIRRADSRGIHIVFLEVRDSNEEAIRLYRRAGFSEVGVRKNFYSLPVEDARIMRFAVDKKSSFSYDDIEKCRREAGDEQEVIKNECKHGT